MQQEGVTDERLVQELLSQLSATKVISVPVFVDGKRTKKRLLVSVPDNEIQLKALELCLKIKGLI